jgi:hypothetical protein
MPNGLSHPIIIALFSSSLGIFCYVLFSTEAPIVHYILAIGHVLSIALKDSLAYFAAIVYFAGSLFR